MPDDNMARLLKIMAALRTPGTGCPWDLEQDFKSIVPYTLEEAHEVAETIEQGDMNALKTELGDLLFQVVFYARLAQEQNLFDFSDVVEAVNEKMVRRHPHVFGEQDKALSNEDIEGQWERIKAAEKEAGGQASKKSILKGVPLTLPALSRAIKLQNKAARVGFDWPSLAPVFDKMREELHELEHEIDSQSSPERIEDEFGDVLFVVANVARHLKIDPEQALRLANNKFVRRFEVIEELLSVAGKNPADSNLEEMEEFWQIAKQREKA
ncbi:MAG: nucleoside triphosphate pyrophosphohydrolase [Hyphomicrobiaceae bacterium]|nr:nucleoside triphosphate pyrophosphohydrolase [Hyphomicrobiaceae bacterium]